jgi:class 3 adenylate cyclase
LGLKNDLQDQVKDIFGDQWDVTDGRVVPEPESIGLGNNAIKLDATVLYADMADSTKMVDDNGANYAAEIYKSFLYCAGRIIHSEQGVITAYDGDRIMAVFIGERKNTRAVKTGLKINYAVKKIINPAHEKQYSYTPYTLKHVVGIDTSKILVARTGVKGRNDLVWVGRAANYAAKLCALSADYPTRITEAVHKVIADDAKMSSSGKNMWNEATWKDMNDMTIYRSTWTWEIS